MLYPSVPLYIGVLLLEQRHAKYHVIVSYFSNDDVDCMALLRSGAVAHLYNLAYNCSSAQSLNIDCGDQRWQFSPLLLPSCHDCFQAEPIHYSLGDEVVGVARVNEC